ncbi:MAG: hypothetical protein NTY15_08880 [Planctomycetota bacterium]|nr:hypothetical protein [Planctomycetota bacterium]
MALSSVVGGVGCEDQNAKRLQDIQVKLGQNKEKRDAIREAFRYLPQLIRQDRTTAMKGIRTDLNYWSKNVVESDSWKPSALLESVSGKLRTIDFSTRMNKLEFGEPECEFLLQCQMMKDVGKWVVERPYRDSLFTPWLESQKTVLAADDWSQLETTLKLFDWSVCNVGIEGQSKDAMRLVTNSELPYNDSAPTYRQLPWQTMMFGRGDTWERARVFTQLAFIQGIDCVVLALPSLSGATENASLRLWCIGVPIGGELYLFEPQWGLPIPIQSKEGIATLREAKENPDVLRRAKLPGRFEEYPVTQADLKNLFALIDAEPFALGRTMHTLERSITGENRVRLSMDTDALEQRLTKMEPNLSIRLWNVPWIAHAYNQSVRERLNDKSPFSMSYIEAFGAFIMDTPICRARTLHFKGQFDNSVEATGALRSYMDVRVDEQTLKDMEFDKEIQASLGVIKQPGEPMENFQFRVAQARQYFRRSKFDVAIFLAMLNCDLGKLDTANDWLQKRLLMTAGTERWHAHAHYLLGRNYEEQGKTAESFKEYEFENSPQEAGNRIRIRLRKALEATAAGPKP